MMMWGWGVTREKWKYRFCFILKNSQLTKALGLSEEKRREKSAQKPLGLPSSRAFTLLAGQSRLTLAAGADHGLRPARRRKAVLLLLAFSPPLTWFCFVG